MPGGAHLHGGRPPWRWALVAVLVATLAVIGLVTLTLGLVALRAPAPAAGSVPIPTAPMAAAAQTPPDPTAETPDSAGAGVRPSLSASPPVSLQIPTIGVDTGLDPLGLNRDNTVQVPKDFDRAGWYTGAPTPGQIGPAVLLGHIDSYRGPAVFYRLATLRPGNTVTVNRADGRPAQFRVDAVREYPKDRFPTNDVYGATDAAELRLITCGGPFDTQTRSYLDNIVVYATLTSPGPGNMSTP